MSDQELNHYFQTVLPFIKNCGRMIRDAYCKMQVTITGSDDHLFTTCNPTVPNETEYEETKQFECKSNEIDWVTETDKAVESYLIGSIKKEFPTHKFIGEESNETHNGLTNEPTWIIDPIDGTTNFIHGMPMCATSVALAINKKVVIGIVYNALQEELFTAIRGRGSYMNGKKIHVTHTTELNRAIVGTNPGSKRHEEFVKVWVENMNILMKNGIAGIKMLGNSAMDSCYCACGRTDCFFEKYLHPWDYAAATLIVEEAGGIVRTVDDVNPLELNGGMIMLGNKSITNKLFEILIK